MSFKAQIFSPHHLQGLCCPFPQCKSVPKSGCSQCFPSLLKSSTAPSLVILLLMETCSERAWCMLPVTTVPPSQSSEPQTPVTATPHVPPAAAEPGQIPHATPSAPPVVAGELVSPSGCQHPGLSSPAASALAAWGSLAPGPCSLHLCSMSPARLVPEVQGFSSVPRIRPAFLRPPSAGTTAPSERRLQHKRGTNCCPCPQSTKEQNQTKPQNTSPPKLSCWLLQFTNGTLRRTFRHRAPGEVISTKLQGNSTDLGKDEVIRSLSHTKHHCFLHIHSSALQTAC